MRSNSNHIKDRHSERVLFNEVIVRFLLPVLCLALFRIYNPKSVSLSQKRRRSAFFSFFLLFSSKHSDISIWTSSACCSFDCSSIGRVSARVWQSPAAAWDYHTAFHQAVRRRRQIASDSLWQHFAHSLSHPCLRLLLLSLLTTYSSLLKTVCSRFQPLLFLLPGPVPNTTVSSKKTIVSTAYANLYSIYTATVIFRKWLPRKTRVINTPLIDTCELSGESLPRSSSLHLLSAAADFSNRECCLIVINTSLTRAGVGKVAKNNN